VIAMASIIATYRAPDGDAPFVEMCGIRFLDGDPVEIDASTDTAHVIQKLRGNQHFDVLDDGEGAPAKKRGRPVKTEE
jgi:hypothetical protein